MAEYYRSRKIAFVVFAVDEQLTGRPAVTNDEVLEFARANADVAIPFISVNPTRGQAAVDEARRLLATGRVRGLKLHPPSRNSGRTTAWRIRSTSCSPKPSCRCCSIPGTAASAPACRAAAASG